MDVYNGIICDSSIQIRKIIIKAAEPTTLHKRVLNILPYDDSILGTLDEEGIAAYEGDLDNSS